MTFDHRHFNLHETNYVILTNLHYIQLCLVIKLYAIVKTININSNLGLSQFNI